MKAINIISFNVPYPANYGGVIDVFYKIKQFQLAGIKVHLHCFDYGRGKQNKLNQYCESVTYYKRKTGIIAQLSSLPYIVKSRISNQLKVNLLKNDFPILFEGLHCCSLLNDTDLKNRYKIVRNHNVEHDYYIQLAKVEKNTLKRKYYTTEAKKLKQFEPILEHANLCLPISKTDYIYFSEKYTKTQFTHIPAFHQNETINIKEGKGNYVLYHGNLSIPENINAAKHIIKNYFNNVTIPLKIAGLNPPKILIDTIKKYKNIELITNPNDDEMNALIANAQINLLYTKQATGLKLKLLNVLYSGRHCIANSKMVAGTTLNKICLIEDDSVKTKQLINKMFYEEFPVAEIEKRKNVLSQEYSNKNSFDKMLYASETASKA